MSASGTITLAATITDGTTGETYALSNTQTINSMSAADKRMFTATTTVRNMILFGTNVLAGQYTALSGVIIINRGTDTDGIRVGVSAGTDTYYILLKPGEFHVLWNRNIDAQESGAGWSAFNTITSISVAATTTSGLVEFLLFHG